MFRARSKFRIKFANITIAMTLLLCIVMIYTGKLASARGDSLQKREQDRIKAYKKMAEEKEAEKNAN